MVIGTAPALALLDYSAVSSLIVDRGQSLTGAAAACQTASVSRPGNKLRSSCAKGCSA